MFMFSILYVLLNLLHTDIVQCLTFKITRAKLKKKKTDKRMYTNHINWINSLKALIPVLVNIYNTKKSLLGIKSKNTFSNCHSRFYNQ